MCGKIQSGKSDSIEASILKVLLEISSVTVYICAPPTTISCDEFIVVETLSVATETRVWHARL